VKLSSESTFKEGGIRGALWVDGGGIKNVTATFGVTYKYSFSTSVIYHQLFGQQFNFWSSKM